MNSTEIQYIDRAGRPAAVHMNMYTYEIQYIDGAGRPAAVHMDSIGILDLVSKFVIDYAPVIVINSIVRLEK